jgi:hypothetical protein
VEKIPHIWLPRASSFELNLRHLFARHGPDQDLARATPYAYCERHNSYQSTQESVLVTSHFVRACSPGRRGGGVGLQGPLDSDMWFTRFAPRLLTTIWTRPFADPHIALEGESRS